MTVIGGFGNAEDASMIVIMTAEDATMMVVMRVIILIISMRIVITVIAFIIVIVNVIIICFFYTFQLWREAPLVMQRML